MRHTLRKYLSNRGSALFMVLSTMTALMVCCMAMYFSVISSRSTQYAIFNQQQAYQSAASLSDAFIAAVNDKKDNFNNIGNDMWNLEVGEYITTNANGFKSFSADGTGNDDDSQAGAYMMTIKRLPDETFAGAKVRAFDIAVTSSVNGTKEVVHNIVHMAPPVDNPDSGPKSVFTATGYVPNDVFLQTSDMRTDIFFDNQHTVIHPYSNGGLSFDGNLYCGGSLSIYGMFKMTSKEPVIFAVRNTYKNYSNQVYTFANPTGTSEVDKNKTRSTVMIGGDCDSGNSKFGNANVYVLGDLILSGYGLDPTSKYFVDGDVILVGGPWGGYWHNLSNVYCNGTVDETKNAGGGINGKLAGKWTGYAQGLEKNGLMTVSEMIAQLEEKTKSDTYYKWIVDYEGVDLSPSKEKTIQFSTDAANPIPTVYLGNKKGKQKDGCVIKDVLVKNSNNVSGEMNYLTLVIDTGEDPDNTYTIRLKANRDFISEGPNADGPDSNGDESFCFFPKNTLNGTDTYQLNSNINFQILTMGRGSVIIDIPEGVTYQDEDRTKFMHYSWFALNGGKEHFFGDGTEATKKERIEHTAFVRKGDSGTDADFFTQFVHRNCKEGDGCNYTENKLTEKCGTCNNALICVECDKHGELSTYCPNCTPAKCKKHKINGCPDCPSSEVDHTGECQYRVDRPTVDKYLNNHTDIKSMVADSKGETIYPNVNIFLVNSAESANIRISARMGATPSDDAAPFKQNSYFGFIYAPYMTFKAKGDGSGGGMVKMMGGLNVSDYIIEDSYSIISCWPDKFPAELMHPDSLKNKLEGNTDKSWKIVLRAH